MLYTNAKDLRSSQIPRSRFKGSSLPQYGYGAMLSQAGKFLGSDQGSALLGNLGQLGTAVGGLDATDGDMNPYAAAGAGALQGVGMGAKLGNMIVPGIGGAIGAGAGALIGGAAGLYKERQQQAQLDEAEAAKLRLEQQRKRALELANLQSSKAVLSTYPTQGVADAGFMMAMGGPVNDPNNPPLPSYNEKANYTPPTLRKDNRLVYGEKGTGGANVNHLNLDPRLVDAGYNLSNTLGIFDSQLDRMIKKYLDKSSKVAFYNEAQQLPFNRNYLAPLSYRVGEAYQEAIEPIDNVLKKLSTLSNEDLKGLESEISKLSKPYLSLGDEESIAGKIISGGKLAVNQDWSGIKPYREKAGLSKDDIVKLIYAREDASYGERIALSGLRGIVKIKDFALGGPTDPPAPSAALMNNMNQFASGYNQPAANTMVPDYSPTSFAQTTGTSTNAPQVTWDDTLNQYKKAGQYVQENPLDAVQIGLGATAIAADAIPLAGTAVSGIADGINAGISGGRAAYYANKGDYGNAAFYGTAAALDGAAAIPGLGNAAGASKIGMLLNKGAHAGHNVIHAAHQGANAVTAYKAANMGYGAATYAMGGKIPTQAADYLAEGGEVIQHAMNDRPDTDQNGDIRQLNSNTSKFVGDSHDAASQGIGVANDEEARIYSKRLYAPKDLVAKLKKL